MDDLKELKYHSEYGLILLMGISKTSDFGRFFQMKETKDVSFTCTLIYKGKLFKREGNTKKEARHNASEALLAYFDITDDEIREKALDIFELATKKNSKLNWDYIIDEFDDAGQPRCKYKSLAPGFPVKTSGSFKNKKDAKKDLVFILLEPIWKDMRFRLSEIKKQGIHHETISDHSNSSNEKTNRNRAHRSSRDKNSNTNAPLGGVIGNGGSNSTHLPSGLSDSSSSCTLSRIQNQSMNHPLPPNMNHPSNQRSAFHPHMVTNGQKENFLPANQNRYPIPPGQNNGTHSMVPNGGYLNRQMHPNMVKSYANGTSSGGGGPNGYNEIGIEAKNYTNGHNPIGHPSLFDSKSLVGQMANMAIRPPGSATSDYSRISVETRSSDTRFSLCIICNRLRKGGRMREVFQSPECIHDSYICVECETLHRQMKKKKGSTLPDQCPLCYLLSFNKKEKPESYLTNGMNSSASSGISSGFAESSNRSLPLSLCAENPKYQLFFRNEATIDEIRHRELQIKQQNRFS